MKRIRKRKTPPKALSDYIADNPESSDTHTWDAFRNNCPSGLKAIQQALYEDQGGLCAYCELELIPKFDLRVSHFHPKRAKGEEGSRAWELRWDNMHGACNGGTIFYYKKPDRYVEGQGDADKHCDVVIGNDVLDDKILNPLHIPAFPRLFQYEEEPMAAGQIGLRIRADVEKCSTATYLGKQGCEVRAQETIDQFHLNSANLMIMRQALYDEIKFRIAQSVESEGGLEAALGRMSEIAFSNTSKWPEFFTVWRWALRDKAEEKLKRINFNG